MLEIDGDRLVRSLRELARMGAYKTGVHRPTYGVDDMAAREWTMARMAAAGLAPELDGIGNVLGRAPGGGPHLLIGSHTETQNHAGWLDGALGVVMGLEIAQALHDAGATGGARVEVVSFADEEGHYGSFLGSRSAIGDLGEAEIDGLAGRYDDRPLRDALAQAGLAGRPRLRLDPQRYRGYLESHIEQGATLERADEQVGVVTSIVAIWQYRIVVEGQQNHAGTTRMADRRDAGLAAVRLLAELDRSLPGVAGPDTVWTTGRVTLEPGAPSIIPGGAEILFQFRDADPGRLAAMEAALTAAVTAADRAGPCPVRLEAVSRSVPAMMDPAMQAALVAAAERRCPGRHRRMPSGAGHDAQVVAKIMPAGMLFVPSIGGISHHWTEDTAEADIVAGGRVLADAAAALLAEAR